MKTAIVLAACGLLVLTGCVQIKTETVIDKNGGGTITMDYTVPADVEEAFKELKTLDGGMDEDMGDVPIFDDSFDKDAFESELKENGARLVAYENGMVDGQRKVHMEIAFKDPAGLEAGMGGALSAGGSIGLFKTQDGNYVLRGVPAPETEEDEAAEELPAEEDMAKAMENAQKSMAVMGKLMAHMNEMVMEMRVTLPGDVISHNAMSLEGRTCVWRIDSSNMMSAQGMDEPEIVFSGEGLDIDVPVY